MSDFTLTGHALERMKEMGVPLEDVVLAVTEPELTYPLREPAGARAYVRGLLAVVVSPDRAVVTVMWNGDFER